MQGKAINCVPTEDNINAYFFLLLTNFNSSYVKHYAYHYTAGPVGMYVAGSNTKEVSENRATFGPGQ